MENIRGMSNFIKQENYTIVPENHTEQERRRRLNEIPSVENALTNILTLPQVVKDVSQIHKGQTLEIKKQQNILDMIQEQLKLVEQQEKRHFEAVANGRRKLCISEEETQKNKQMCIQYEKEISNLMKECESETSVIFHLKKTIKEEQWEHEKCKEKVLRYKDDKNLKITSEGDSRLKEVKVKVEELKLKCQSIQQQNEERKTISNGMTNKKGKFEFEELKIQEKENKEKIQTAKQNVEKSKKEIKQTEQSTYVLHKRNKAQMTRFKRELKELTSQSSYSKEKLIYLQQQISHLHQQIFMDK